MPGVGQKRIHTQPSHQYIPTLESVHTSINPTPPTPETPLTVNGLPDYTPQTRPDFAIYIPTLERVLNPPRTP